MRIHYYNRDPQGLISHGREDAWESIDAFLIDAGQSYRLNDTPEAETLKGWPDERVYWFGPVGIGSRTYEQ